MAENCIFIYLDSIPPFYHKSNLFRRFYDYGCDDIYIDKKYFKTDIKILSIDDLFELIEIIKYWFFDEVPFEIYDYVVKNKNTILESRKDNFINELINDCEIKHKKIMYQKELNKIDNDNIIKQ